MPSTDLEKFPIQPFDPADEDYSKLPLEFRYDGRVDKTLEWYQEHMAGLPDVFFEQMERVENGELTKKQVKNIHKKYLKKIAKENVASQ